MKKLFSLILLMLFLLSKNANQENKIISLAEKDRKKIAQLELIPVESYPLKTAAYWTSPIMRRSDAINLAKHDLVIVDLENKFNNRQILLELKKMNPKIKLLAYSNPMEIFLTTYSNRPWQNKVIIELTKKRQKWLLKTIKNEKGLKRENYAQYWPEMIMLNMSSDCPKINGQTYSEWMARKIESEILSDPVFDGYFMDNGTINISWIYKSKVNEKIDIDGNKRAENDLYIDRRWSEGVNAYLHYLRYNTWTKPGIFTWLVDLFAKKNNKIIISNKGDLNLLKYVDGKFFENFPNSYLGEAWADGWRQSLRNTNKTGEYSIIHVQRGDLEFGLASALLLDNVYLAIGQDDAGIFPDFNLQTGKPLGPMTNRKATYMREYERIKVIVEPLKKSGKIIVKY
jgi:hypothetical protein